MACGVLVLSGRSRLYWQRRSITLTFHTINMDDNSISASSTLEKKKKISCDQNNDSPVVNKSYDPAEHRIQTIDDLDLPGYLSKQYLPLYGMCFISYFCATMQGYDGSLMGSIYTMDSYLDYYNLDVNSSTGTGLVFSIYNIGQICAAFFVSLMDWKGRKVAILVGVYGVVIGAIITAATTTRSGLIGGRWFLSFFATIANSSAPTYCVELAPSHLRGKVAGLYNTLWYVGSIVAAFTSYGSNKNYPNSSKAFKIPLYLQMMFPGVVCIFGWLLPESPRWLVGVGREEEARDFIVQYHCNGEKDHPLVDLEMAEIIESFHGIRLSDPIRMLDLRPLIKRRSDVYRLGLVVAMAWFGQFSGNNVCSYYLPTMLNNVGMHSVSTNVLMNGVYSIVSWISSVLGSFCHDKVGRRKMFMISIIGAALALTGLSVCTARFEATGTKGASTGSLVFIYLFGVIFSFAYTPMQSVYSSEVSTNLMRSKAQLVNNIVSGIAQFVNQFAAPKAMENIRYWFYVFYAFFDIFQFFIIYFFFVETRNRSLEELAAVFEAPNPRKASTDEQFIARIRENMALHSQRLQQEKIDHDSNPQKIETEHFELNPTLGVV